MSRAHQNRLVYLTAVSGLLLAGARAAVAVDAGVLGRAQTGRPAVRVKLSTEERDVFEYDNREGAKADLEGQFVEICWPIGNGVALEGELGRQSWDPHSEHGLNYDAGTAWGLGVAAILPLQISPQAVFSQWLLGWAVRYRYGEPDSDYRRDVHQEFAPETEEWQVSCELIGCLPHGRLGVGGRYSQVDLRYSHPDDYGKREGGFEEDTPWGIFLDGELTLGSAIISAEVRLVDVTGGTLAVGWRF